MAKRTSSTSESSETGSVSGGLTRGRFRFGPVVELARVDVRRGVRWARAQDFWLLYGLVSAAGLLFGTRFAFDLGRELGRALAAGETLPISVATLRTLLGAVWLGLVGFLIVDAVGSNGDVERDGHYLTVLPAATLAHGKLLAAAVKFAAFLFAPAIGGFLGVALGTGTPLPLVGGLLAATVMVSSATAVGYPVGLTLKGAIRRSPLLSRLKPLFAVALGVGYVVVMITGEFPGFLERLAPVLRTPPLGWLADLAFATTTGLDTSPITVLGAVVAATGTVLVGSAVAVPAARYAWSADRTQSSAGRTDGAVEPPTHPIDSLVGAVSRAQATRSVAFTTLQRAYRSPLQLVFAAIPLVAAIPVGERLLETGELPWFAPWLAVWYGSWAAGASVPLNPLGNQGAALPALLTSPADGRHVVHGHVLAAALPVVPVTAVVAVAAGLLGGRPMGTLAVLGIGAVGAVLAATVLAAGIGSVFPRFEAVDFGDGRRATPPSKVAYGVFSTVLSVAVIAVAAVSDDTAGVVIARLLSAWLPLGLDVGVAALTAGSWILLGLVAGAIPVAYLIAVRRIGGYRVS